MRCEYKACSHKLPDIQLELKSPAPPSDMFSQLVVVITLALWSAATPVVVNDNLIRLPLARRFNATGTTTILQHDQARAKGLKTGSQAGPKTTSVAAAAAASGTSFPEAITNGAVTYTAEVRSLRHNA